MNFVRILWLASDLRFLRSSENLHCHLLGYDAKSSWMCYCLQNYKPSTRLHNVISQMTTIYEWSNRITEIWQKHMQHTPASRYHYSLHCSTSIQFSRWQYNLVKWAVYVSIRYVTAEQCPFKMFIAYTTTATKLQLTLVLLKSSLINMLSVLNRFFRNSQILMSLKVWGFYWLDVYLKCCTQQKLVTMNHYYWLTYYIQRTNRSVRVLLQTEEERKHN